MGHDGKVSDLGAHDLRDLLTAALHRIDQLEARVAELEPGRAVVAPSPVSLPPASAAVPWPSRASLRSAVGEGGVGVPPERMDRRHALKGAAIVAGAAAAGAVLGDARPAAAVNGSNLVIAGSNTGSSSTFLTCTGSSVGGFVGFQVLDQTPGQSTNAVTGAIGGHAKGANFVAGVYGHAEGGNIGVFGISSSGAGVEGHSTSGAGVQGKSAGEIGVYGESQTWTGVHGASSSGDGVRGVTNSSSSTVGAVHGTTGPGIGVLGVSTSNIGVKGTSTSNYGVVGTSTSALNAGVIGTNTTGTGSHGVEGITASGHGVHGSASSGVGTYGTSISGAGVTGESTNLYGVDAFSTNSTGVRARGKVFGVIAQSFSTSATDAAVAASTLQAMGIYVNTDSGQVMTSSSDSGGGIEVKAPKWHLRLGNAATRNAPTSDAFAHAAGEVVFSTAGELWVCVKGGTPGTWRKLGSQQTAGSFHVLAAPARIYDSRPGTSPAVGSKTPLAKNTPRVLDVKANSSGVPAGATAALLTVLLVNAAAGSGNLTVWANSVAKPEANTMVWGPSGGRFTATSVSALSSGGGIQVQSSLVTDIVIDVVGYYR